MYQTIQQDITYIIVEDKEELDTLLESSLDDKIIIGCKELEDERLEQVHRCYRLEKEIEDNTNKTSVIMKLINKKDVKVFCRLANEIMAEVPASVAYERRFTEQLINSGYHELFFIEDKKRKIGIVEISYEEDDPEIISIGLSTPFRRLGYGKEVLKIIEKYLYNKNYKHVTIVVSDHNAAAYHLYLNQGYHIKENVMNYYKIKK